MKTFLFVMLKMHRQNWKIILLLINKRVMIKQKYVTTEIAEYQEDDEVLDNAAVHSTKNTELTTTESVEREITELSVKNVKTSEKLLLMT